MSGPNSSAAFFWIISIVNLTSPEVYGLPSFHFAFGFSESVSSVKAGLYFQLVASQGSTLPAA